MITRADFEAAAKLAAGLNNEEVTEAFITLFTIRSRNFNRLLFRYEVLRLSNIPLPSFQEWSAKFTLS